MRTFTVYRSNPPTSYFEKGYANRPDEPQFEGVQFTDGTVAVRWMTSVPSTSVWASLQNLLSIHGHADYESYLIWSDGTRLVI